MVLIVAFAGGGLRRELLSLQEQQLARELALAALLVESAGPAAPDSLTDLITRRIGYRTTLIALDGRVLGDSDVRREDLARLENHADRPEVRAARETGEVAFARRTSATVGSALLYGAVPTTLDRTPVVVRVAAPMSEVVAMVGRTQRTVATVGLFATMVALAVAFVLGKAFTRPLVALADRSAALAGGDFSRRAPRNTHLLELDELSLAFNRLADELQARLGELSRERDEMQALLDGMAEGVIALTEDARVMRTNEAGRELLRIPAPAAFAPVGSVVRQPELRELMEEAVVRPVEARDIQLDEHHLIVSSRPLGRGGAVVTFLDVTEIRRLEQVRRDFVANVSHELKTPLTTIRGFAETLMDDSPPEPLRRQFLGAIHDSSIRLHRLVDDLLDLSRLESGGWVARREVVDVAGAAEAAWEALAEGAAGRDVGFAVEGEGLARADEQGLHQVFQNLFDNALRHTPEGGRIDVTLRRREETLEVAVRDTGSGIPSKALPRVFERFYRADPSRSRAEGGTGLGLAIVRHLVSAMDGDIRAESELGRGTTIRFALPAERERDV